MDFRFAPEDEAFRQEVRTFVAREWRPDSRYDYSQFGPDIDIPEVQVRVNEFEKKLASKGWYTMHWPKPWGPDASISRQLVYREEMTYQGAPAALGGGFFAQSLIVQGQDWQKEYFLPKIANAEIDICQGFSEPNAGSDLGNLQTRAVRDGDDFVITGQKIWTSGAHRADWGHFLVRTDPSAPKHRGISYFLVDMKSPGITLRPLYNMLGTRTWNETFLDGVRVPARNMIGDENRGWYAAMTTLSFERSNVQGPAAALRSWERFVDRMRRLRLNGQRPSDDPITRHVLADLRVQIEVARMLSYRVAWMQVQGQVPVKEASISKVAASELGQRVARTLARLAHEHGVLLPGNDPSIMRYGDRIGFNNFNVIGNAIAGGANEIQRNIIAQRGLGLPR
jgi:alkylation response protein AidB-like acyl-CoA dehydrogenase